MLPPEPMPELREHNIDPGVEAEAKNDRSRLRVSPAASHVGRDQPLPAELIAHQTRTINAAPDERAHLRHEVTTEGRATAAPGPFGAARPSRSPLTRYRSSTGRSRGVHAAIVHSHRARGDQNYGM